jgi:hypothetical protein
MNNHLDHQQMLAYLDGELSRAETHRAAEHLHSCWTCRTEVEHLKDDITTILDSQKGTFSPALPPPPAPWPAFHMLVARSAPAPQPNFWMRLTATLSVVAAPSRVLAVSVAAIGIVLFAFVLFRSPAVSAKEVLRRVEVADGKRSEIATNQVIRERVHIRRTTRSSGRQDSTIVNTWKSRKGAYWETSNDDAVVSDFEAEYKSYGVSVGLPLSASSATDWGKAVGGSPTVSRQGADLDLIYAATPSASSDSVRQVSFLIQPDTWTVKQMTLALSDSSFEVTQDNFDIVPSSSLPPLLLAELELAPFPSTVPSAAIRTLPRMGHNIVAPGLDLDSAELDVFSTLHQLKVDLGEPVTVTRTQNSVQVGVWQLPEDRRNELRAALSDKPGVQVLDRAPRIVVARVAEAPPAPTQSSGPLHIAVDSGNDDRLFKFFGTSEKEQDFTSRALATSTDMLSHLYALRNLQAQFPRAREQALSLEARTRLAELVQDHAAAIAGTLEALKIQLAPLDTQFHVPQSPPPGNSPTVDWHQESLDGLGTGKAIDHLLRALLTTSQDPVAPESALPEIDQQISRLGAKVRDLAISTH